MKSKKKRRRWDEEVRKKKIVGRKIIFDRKKYNHNFFFIMEASIVKKRKFGVIGVLFNLLTCLLSMRGEVKIMKRKKTRRRRWDKEVGKKKNIRRKIILYRKKYHHNFFSMITEAYVNWPNFGPDLEKPAITGTPNSASTGVPLRPRRPSDLSLKYGSGFSLLGFLSSRSCLLPFPLFAVGKVDPLAHA